MSEFLALVTANGIEGLIVGLLVLVAVYLLGTGNVVVTGNQKRVANVVLSILLAGVSLFNPESAEVVTGAIAPPYPNRLAIGERHSPVGRDIAILRPLNSRSPTASHLKPHASNIFACLGCTSGKLCGFIGLGAIGFRNECSEVGDKIPSLLRIRDILLHQHHHALLNKLDLG